MLTIGIDPDSQDLAIGVWDANGPQSARVIHVTGSASNYEMLHALRSADPLEWQGSHPTAVAIEGQQIDSRSKSAKSLFKLAHMTGAAALWVVQQLPSARLLIPEPSAWKKGVAKHAHQGRLYNELGWGYEIVGSGKGRYARPLRVPAAFSHITRGQWKHVGDALLLARWAQTQ